MHIFTKWLHLRRYVSNKTTSFFLWKCDHFDTLCIKGLGSFTKYFGYCYKHMILSNRYQLILYHQTLNIPKHLCQQFWWPKGQISYIFLHLRVWKKATGFTRWNLFPIQQDIHHYHHLTASLSLYVGECIGQDLKHMIEK